jgi:hypothetical protein
MWTTSVYIYFSLFSVFCVLSSDLKYLDVIIQQVDFRHTTDHVQHMVQRLIEVGFIIAHGSYSQGNLLPEIIIIDLSHRDIELVPDPVLQAAKGMSLSLERTAVGHMDFDGTDADEHNQNQALNPNFEILLFDIV